MVCPPYAAFPHTTCLFSCPRKTKYIHIQKAKRGYTSFPYLQEHLDSHDTSTGKQSCAERGDVADTSIARDSAGGVGWSSSDLGASGGGRGVGLSGASISGDGSGQGGGSLGALVRLRSVGRSVGGSLGRRLGGGLVIVVIIRAAVALDNLDALPVTSLVGPDVLLDILVGRAITTGIVGDLDALVVTERGTVGEIGATTGPLDGALGGVLAASNPGTELDLHGGLRESAAALGLLIGQGTDSLAIDDPVDSLGSPLNRVGVE